KNWRDKFQFTKLSLQDGNFVNREFTAVSYFRVTEDTFSKIQKIYCDDCVIYLYQTAFCLSRLLEKW
ncbi:MAG: hypothetical protein ACI6PN_08230, partial [Polaribacter sp.]|uniref:hypothetical protein n=1 Tax=Polaribacter sp. TaxID=1920175 RepID=UPI00384FAA17